MKFTIESVSEDGVNVKADTGYQNHVSSKFTQEELAAAVTFFWKALVMLNVFLDDKMGAGVTGAVKGLAFKESVEKAEEKGRKLLIEAEEPQKEKEEELPF